MQPVRPLTRREMRERDAAPPPAPAPGAGGWQQPARPAAPSGPPPSRRTSRETTGPAEHPAQPSVDLVQLDAALDQEVDVLSPLGDRRLAVPGGDVVDL
ncbi:hypothetical protein OY671_006664, partial [Metschnikowia pulcherrima]